MSRFIDAAITVSDRNPKTPHMPAEHIMPIGTAREACVASSLICTHESKAPIVQMGDSQAMIKAQPVGHVV